MQITKAQLWVNAKDYIFIILGIILYAIGFAGFIAPYNIIPGGMAGLGQVVYYLTLGWFGWGVPVAVTMYVVNILLLSLAYKIVGKTFVLRTIFGVTCVSLFIGIAQLVITEAVIKDEPFMSVIIGSALIGIGLGLTFIHNGSTGGTDIVAAIASKKSNVSVGRAMQYTDFCIISSSLLIFGFPAGVERLVYGYCVLIVMTFMVDQMINTNRQAVQFTIFSPHWEEIATAINNEANRGCTVINAMGWYSKQDVKVLLVMCRKIESVTIYRIIKSIDNDAFITQANVNGVYGRGFDELKLKMRKPHHHDEKEHAGARDHRDPGLEEATPQRTTLTPTPLGRADNSAAAVHAPLPSAGPVVTWSDVDKHHNALAEGSDPDDKTISSPHSSHMA